MIKIRGGSIALFAIMLIGLLLSACSNGQTSEMNEAADMAVATEESGYGGVSDREVVAEKEMLEEAPKSDDSIQTDNSERMVIYHANLSLEVNDYHQSEADIEKRVKELGGFVIESSIYGTGEEQIYGNLVVKVPQLHFQSFINEVESNSVKVHERYVSGNDVTEEYVDLESRIRSKRVVEKRLLAFMEEATNTEDLLKISSDLAKVQEEIEQIVGRMNYLEKNVEFSTITIHLQENKVNVPSIQGREDLDTWAKSKSLFMETINNTIALFSGLVVLLVGLSPIFLPIAVFVLVVVYRIRKKRKNSEAL